jgi:Tfp pilus assembly protein PilW
MTYGRGFSTVELMIYSGVIAVVALFGAHFFKTTIAADQFYKKAAAERTIHKALDIVVSDLQEADVSSIHWDLLPSTSIQFSHTHYGVMVSTGALTNIGYELRPIAGSTQFQLVRTVSGGPSAEQILVTSLDPAASQPFQKDPSIDHMIDIELIYHPAGVSAYRAVRKVAIEDPS